MRAPLSWTGVGRLTVFVLAASSIACLLLELYGVVPMRWFTPCVFLPAFVALGALTWRDGRAGDRRLMRAVSIGALAGLLATVAYDLFRLPFVFAKPWGLSTVLPALPLFKVFPLFGAMILGGPADSAAAHAVGWLYHFSNGLTFGVMYAAMVGDGFRRRWVGAVAMALGLELAMLFTPYPRAFGIAVGAAFVIVTLAAHLVFGVTLGLGARWLDWKWDDGN